MKQRVAMAGFLILGFSVLSVLLIAGPGQVTQKEILKSDALKKLRPDILVESINFSASVSGKTVTLVGHGKDLQRRAGPLLVLSDRGRIRLLGRAAQRELPFQMEKIRPQLSERRLDSDRDSRLDDAEARSGRITISPIRCPWERSGNTRSSSTPRIGSGKPTRTTIPRRRSSRPVNDAGIGFPERPRFSSRER